ncbi:CAP domain-containing protein [Nonomuraea rubra]|uniref:CAP domain-containing protein n=1 Tax=Nonomuraea rubra TaxID=46180 RepID=UPI0033FE364D
MSDLSPFVPVPVPVPAPAPVPVKTRARRTLRLLGAAATAGSVAIGLAALSGTAQASAAGGGVASGGTAVGGAAQAPGGVRLSGAARGSAAEVGAAPGIWAVGGAAQASGGAGIGCDVAAAYYDTAPQSGNLAMVRQAVLCLINAERARAGLRPYTRNSALDAAAASHADAAARLKWWRPGANSHTNPQTGSTPGSRITAAGYCPNPLSWAYAETTYTGWGGSGTPRAAVHWWVHVSTYGHRQIVLSPTLVDAGVGAAAGAADPAGAGASGGGTFVVDYGRCQR